MNQEEQDRRIDYIEFAAKDLAATRQFYETVFGWTFKDWGSEYTSFNDGRMRGGFSTDLKQAPGGALVVLFSTDLNGIEEQVKKNGGTIVKPTFEFPGGRRFHFADPSGNVLAVWSEQ